MRNVTIEPDQSSRDTHTHKNKRLKHTKHKPRTSTTITSNLKKHIHSNLSLLHIREKRKKNKKKRFPKSTVDAQLELSTLQRWAQAINRGVPDDCDGRKRRRVTLVDFYRVGGLGSFLEVFFELNNNNNHNQRRELQ